MPEDSSTLILLAHGSRDGNWCDTFEKGLGQINARLPRPASLAYMEMAAPSLESVISGHYLRGRRDFVILPLFFAEGRHLLHDVPALIDTLEKRFTGARIELLGAVGSRPAFWTSMGDMIADEYGMTMKSEKQHEAKR